MFSAHRRENILKDILVCEPATTAEEALRTAVATP